MKIQPSISVSNYCGIKDQVVNLVCHFRSTMYPHIFGPSIDSDREPGVFTEEKRLLFIKLLNRVGVPDDKVETIIEAFLGKLPGIKAMLETDIQAAYRGDPAAHSHEEILLAYPSIEVMSVHRLAHVLYKMEVPILPRMMSEYAHSITGIDIHPGAQIEPFFFIDHGTGVVIGETATIGEHVKIYQGVTIGAKSFEVSADGSLIKGKKRHPDIGNHVVIYAGATILGGDTHIGDHCVIGGNVWLTHSIEKNKTIVAPQPIEERG